MNDKGKGKLFQVMIISWLLSLQENVKKEEIIIYIYILFF